VDHAYNSQGYLTQQRMSVGGSLSGNDVLLWTVEQQDALDRVKRHRNGNGIVTRRDFNATTARLEAMVAGPLVGADINANVLNDTYLYDALGNLTSRTQLKADLGLLSETFTYDSLNRLRTAQVAGQATQSTDFDEIGNLTAKTGVGTYAYPVWSVRAWLEVAQRQDCRAAAPYRQPSAAQRLALSGNSTRSAARFLRTAPEPWRSLRSPSVFAGQAQRLPVGEH
jgi:hypothetical protein